MGVDGILDSVEKYYTKKLQDFGPVFKGVDWSSKESQELRFKQLLKLCNEEGHFSINDYGCGYGALLEYMTDLKLDFEYCGYDLSAEMIFAAKELFKDRKNCQFFSDKNELKAIDYTIASGIFNVKLDTDQEKWNNYALDVINDINALSKKGFAFNMLTKYSDKEFMRDDLYYADPSFYLDHCKKNISKKVSVLHDYDLYEFTIIVRK